VKPYRKSQELRMTVALLACIARAAAAQQAASTGDAAPKESDSAQSQDGPLSVFARDAKDYFTAPLHWDSDDWIYFGGTLAAIAAAHHYDDQVRRHFTIGPYAGNLTSTDTHDLQDAAPTVAVVGLTWFYSGLVRDSNGQRETDEMVEAAILSSASSELMKFAIRREGPDVTDDSTTFGGGGGSFPSLHSSLAFSVGTILAESGNDDLRWIRRVLGYGLGAFTSYERLKHNAHWLSDTVAGAGLGIATAHFVMNRHSPQEYSSNFNVVPIAGGAMLTFSTALPP
jgi:membrane-associated phospholipid phosphatase